MSFCGRMTKTMSFCGRSCWKASRERVNFQPTTQTTTKTTGCRGPVVPAALLVLCQRQVPVALPVMRQRQAPVVLRQVLVLGRLMVHQCGRSCWKASRERVNFLPQTATKARSWRRRIVPALRQVALRQVPALPRQGT